MRRVVTVTGSTFPDFMLNFAEAVGFTVGEEVSSGRYKLSFDRYPEFPNLEIARSTSGTNVIYFYAMSPGGGGSLETDLGHILPTKSSRYDYETTFEIIDTEECYIVSRINGTSIYENMMFSKMRDFSDGEISETWVGGSLLHQYNSDNISYYGSKSAILPAVSAANTAWSLQSNECVVDVVSYGDLYCKDIVTMTFAVSKKPTLDENDIIQLEDGSQYRPISLNGSPTNAFARFTPASVNLEVIDSEA